MLINDSLKPNSNAKNGSYADSLKWNSCDFLFTPCLMLIFFLLNMCLCLLSGYFQHLMKQVTASERTESLVSV